MPSLRAVVSGFFAGRRKARSRNEWGKCSDAARTICGGGERFCECRESCRASLRARITCQRSELRLRKTGSLGQAPRAGPTPAASPSFFPLDGDVGHGLALFRDSFTGTPNVGFGYSDSGARDYRIGWRLTSAVEGDPGFEANLDATRREAANDNHAAEHAVMLKSLMRW